MVGAWFFGCLSCPPGFTCWISFAPLFSFIYCWVLILALSPFYILIHMFKEMMHWKVMGLSCKPNVYASWFASELRVKLAPWNRFKPSSKIFYWPLKTVLLLCFSVLCLLCLCFFCLFLLLRYIPSQQLWSLRDGYAFVRACLYVPCGHLLGKGWPLGPRLWCLTVS